MALRINIKKFAIPLRASPSPLSRDLLRQILFEQQQRILAKPLGIPRENLSQIKESIKIPHVLVITGMRRVGKSTLLRQIMHYEFQDQNFYYITFEDERLKNFPSDQFTSIYETLVEVFGEKKTFFLDEVQNIEGYERFIRRFMDQGFKIHYELNGGENETREINGLIECVKALKQKEGYILTYNQFDNRTIEELNIIITPVWFWALNNFP